MNDVVAIQKIDADKSPALLEQLKDPFLLEYFGKKNGQEIRRPWFRGAIMILRDNPVYVERDVATRLMAENFGELVYREFKVSAFEQFRQQQVEKLTAAMQAEKAAQDDHQQSAPTSTATVDELSDIEFEIDPASDSYLCPFCDKTYKVNKGRGKRVMVEHLEKDHAEQWAQALAGGGEVVE